MAEERKIPYEQMVDKPYLGEWTLDDGNNGWIEKEGIIISCRQGDVVSEKGTKSSCIAQTNLGKPFVVNKGSKEVLKQITGSRYPKDWNNIPVIFYVLPKVRAFGTTVAGLRIKPRPNVTARVKPELKIDTPTFNKAKAAVEEGTYDLPKLKEFYTITPEVQKALNL